MQPDNNSINNDAPAGTAPGKLKSGLEFLGTIDPDGPTRMLELRTIAPELVDALINRLYGEVYQRDGLSLRERFLVTVAVTMASGHMEMPLRYQCNLAMRNGITGEELMEVAQQVSVFSGFPVAIAGMQIIDEIGERLAVDRAEKSE